MVRWHMQVLFVIKNFLAEIEKMKSQVSIPEIGLWLCATAWDEPLTWMC